MSKGGYTAPSPGCSDVARRLLHSAWRCEAGVRHVRRDGGQRGRGAAGLCRAVPVAGRDQARRARLPPARGGAVVPPHRHHLRGLRRGRGAGAADPVRRHPAHPFGGRMGRAAARPGAARQGDQRLHQGHLRPARNPQGRHRARGSGVPESGVPAGDERPEGAARHLRAYRRHRHRARRRRRLLRARGQCAHAVRRLLHAGEPRDHAAAVPGAVLAPPRRAGRELPGRAAGDAEIGRAADALPAIRPSCCSRPASTTRPTTSTRSWPTSSASSWSRAATSSSRATSSTCARPKASSAST